jgi:hypothetical protein
MLLVTAFAFEKPSSRGLASEPCARHSHHVPGIEAKAKQPLRRGEAGIHLSASLYSGEHEVFPLPQTFPKFSPSPELVHAYRP